MELTHGEYRVRKMDDLNWVVEKRYESKQGKTKGQMLYSAVSYHGKLENALRNVAEIHAECAMTWGEYLAELCATWQMLIASFAVKGGA